MVDERLRDGKRIAQLLASELTGDRDDLAAVAVTDPNPDVEPTADGAFAYAVTLVDDPDELTVGPRGRVDAEGVTGRKLAEAFVQADRARVEFVLEPDAAAEAAREADLRVRPKAVRPPRTLVFVEDGAQVKWILPVFEAVVDAASA